MIILHFWKCLDCECVVMPGDEYVSVTDDANVNGVMCLKCALIANYETNGGFLGVNTTNELIECGIIKFRPKPSVKSRKNSVKSLLN